MVDVETLDHPVTVEIPEDLSDLVPEFMVNRQKEVDAIPEVLKSGDFKQIRIWGHNMAGCGAGYGFPDITDLGRALETAALARDKEAIVRCVAGLSSYLKFVKIVYC